MNTRPVKKPLFLAATVGLLLLTSMPAMAQPPAVNIQGGNVTLSITTGLAGAEPLAVVNTATNLRYRRLGYIQKVTVQTSCPGQSFNLSVIAISATDGTPSSEITLIQGMPAVNFITNIPTGGGFATATLNYTASATFAQGNSAELGNDTHTVTYTISAQ